MIAARTLVDARRAAKLAPDHHGHISFQSAFVQVRDEGMHGLIVFGQRFLSRLKLS
jgi:hypothetical protein